MGKPKVKTPKIKVTLEDTGKWFNEWVIVKDKETFFFPTTKEIPVTLKRAIGQQVLNTGQMDKFEARLLAEVVARELT